MARPRKVKLDPLTIPNELHQKLIAASQERGIAVSGLMLEILNEAMNGGPEQSEFEERVNILENGLDMMLKMHREDFALIDKRLAKLEKKKAKKRSLRVK